MLSKKCFLVFLAAVLLLGLASAEVKVATKANFDEVVGATELTLVKFYAPWCGHCKKLAPEFEKAAELLEGQATLADVDCTVEKELAERFDIKGYPTLLLFRNGKQSGKYESGRDTKSIVTFMNGNSGPAIKSASNEAELKKLIDNSAAVCVIKTASEDSEILKVMNTVAEHLRTSMTFVRVTDAAVAPDTPMESIQVYRADGTEAYSGALSVPEVEAFLKLAQLPFVGEIGPSTFSNYMALNSMPIAWIYVSGKDAAALTKGLIDVAKAHRKEVLLCWVDSDQYAGLGEQMGLPKNAGYPAMVIDVKQKHHILHEPNVDAAAISAFVERFLKGETTPTLRSDPAPDVETTDGLTTLVGTTFIDALKAKKEMFVLFYAPWCGHCKQLHPIFEEAAKELESADVIVAKLDATTNDVDREVYPIQGFPTMYFIKSNGAAVPYNGQRTKEAIVSFVKSQISAAASADDEGDL